MQKRRDDVEKRNDQGTKELPTPGALAGAQVVTYSLKEPQDASVIERGGGRVESMKGVGGDQRLTSMTEKRERRGMSDERPVDNRGKKKEQESKRDEPRRSDEVMIQEIIFDEKRGDKRQWS